MSASKLLSLFLSFFLLQGAIAQSIKLGGKVLNEKNEPQPGVSVKVTGGTGTSTGVDGVFTLSLEAGKKYEITFSSVGYATKTLSDVEVFAAQPNELNITLEVASKDLGGVTVTATATTARRENVASIIQFQKNTNTVASVISAESIRRSPDRNTGEVLKRTPGASIQDGKFIIVRGLADRYNQAMLNGILLTSTEPDRKTFSFDLIPSAMIDNIVINKAFVPEYPGEWAGGLIQVNTKDIPTKGFFNVQLGLGYNTQSTGKTFYRDNAGKWDWLGIDDGTRALPDGYTTKSNFDTTSFRQKTTIGKSMRNAWAPEQTTAPLNLSFQANGGFSSFFLGKKVGGTIGLTYSKNNRYQNAVNRQNTLIDNTQLFSEETDYNDDRYLQDISVGALGSFALQFNPLNKISIKSIVNVNSVNGVTLRNGVDRTRPDTIVTASELSFRQNTFFTTQIAGDHSLSKSLKFKWYGAFNILDGYVPDQRRLFYTKNAAADQFKAVISNSLSQQSGSRVYQNLSDYIYTGGGDLSYNFNLFDRKHTLKGGYMLQIKDRLYDAQLFANYLPVDNNALKILPPSEIFAPENFGNGTDNKFAFDAIKNKNFRYLANTILNAGFIQFDNQLSDALRMVWGLRVENYDQLVGSVKAYDARHFNTQVTDFLPGVNLTYKLNNKTNIRLSGSQTVIRPELRELSFLNLYDFELNASVQGDPELLRTKVTNADVRYEWYPRSGEVLTGGVFYKNFKNPIEQFFTRGAGGASTFQFNNAEKAVSYGAELEFRKKLDFTPALKNFTLQSNVSYIYSRVTDTALKIDRRLQGQSPYVLNLGLLYDLEEKGLSATLLFNQIGERIYVVGDKSAGSNDPDVYEAPRPLLDFQMAKKLLAKRAEIKLSVSDIINRRQFFYQNANAAENVKLDKDIDAYRFTRRFGTTFNLTFNYSL